MELDWLDWNELAGWAVVPALTVVLALFGLLASFAGKVVRGVMAFFSVLGGLEIESDQD